jgi:hypothetical protein
MGPVGNIAHHKFVTLPFTFNWKSIPGECLFALSFFAGIQLPAALAIDSYAFGAPCEDLITSGRVVYNIPGGFIGFSMLWSGSRGLGTWVLLSSPFRWSFLVASMFPIGGVEKCSDGVDQDEKNVPVSELPGGC